MITFCPGCAREIGEKDEVCPFCNKDFRSLRSGARTPIPSGPEASAPGTYTSALKEGPPEMAPEASASKSLSPWLFAVAVAAGLVYFHPGRTTPAAPGRPAPLPGAPETAAPGEASSSPPIQESPYEQSVEVTPLPATPTPGPGRPPGRRARTLPERPIFIASEGEQEEPDAEKHPRRASSEWRIHGTVFDIMTLKGIAEADMVFTDSSNGRKYPTATDSSGHYRATLPVSEEGYALMITHPLYEPKYAQDEDGALRRMDEENRGILATRLSQTLQQKDTIKAYGGQRVQIDFAMVSSGR